MRTVPLAITRRLAALALTLITGFGVFVTPNIASAKTFSNAYVSFELSDKWGCVLEQTEWVCRPTAPELQQLGIIILTAKEIGPSDSLPAYKEHLSQPRVIASRSGQPLNSKLMKVEERTIGGQPWIDGMHESSEVPNFFTRYLATTKDKIAILVTFSAHITAYSKFNGDFFKAIESLRVIATASLMNGRNGGAGDQGQGGGTGAYGANGNGGFGVDFPAEEQQGGGGGESSHGFNDKTKVILAIAVLLLGAGIYLLIKRGQKRR